MADDDPPPLRARRWTPPPGTGTRSSPQRSYRFVIRLLGIPIIVFLGVFLYSGIRNRLVLPQCDSERARKSLAEVLNQFQLEPTPHQPITTVSTSKDQVVCSAVLPLPDGTRVAVDFTFYWQGDTADMRYSVARQRPAASDPTEPPVFPKERANF